MSDPMQLKIVTKLDWPSFRFVASTIRNTLKSRCTCAIYSWSSVRPGGRILFLGTFDNEGLRFVNTLSHDSEVIWYATTEGLSKIDDRNQTTTRKIRIIAASAFVKQMLEKVKIPVAGMLHHGIEMSDTRTDFQFHRKLKSKFKNRKIILTVSANHPRKGLDKLLEAYKKVEQQDPDVFLIVHSQNDGHHNLMELAKRINVKRLWLTNSFGKMTRLQLNALYRLCTLYVQPSLSEGFGLPILEAFRFQKGVIAVDATPFTEIIENEHNGILVPSQGTSSIDYKNSIRFQLHEYASSDLANAIIKYLYDSKLQSKIESNIQRDKWRWDAGRLYPQLLSYFRAC